MSGSSPSREQTRRNAKPRAFVLGGTTAGLAVIRSLGRRGIPVTALASRPRPPGLSSRHAEPVLLPPFAEGDGPWLEYLLQRAERERERPVLIPCGDDEVFFAGRNRTALADAFRFTVPGDRALAAAADKRELRSAAEEAGVPFPETRFPEGSPEEADLDPGPIGFPCILKPACSHLWRRRGAMEKLAVAANPGDLERLYRSMWRPGEPLMIQEIIPGGDDSLVGYLACRDERSRTLGFLTKRKLRQHPPRFGNGSVQISERCDEAEKLSVRLLDSLAYAGMAGIEYKRDERTGALLLLDLNPRAVSGEQLAVDAGVDLPHIHYRDGLGEEPASLPPFREGVKYVHLSWDAQAFLALRKEGSLSLPGWIRSLAGARSFALLSLTDPAPFFSVLRRALRHFTRRLPGLRRSGTAERRRPARSPGG